MGATIALSESNFDEKVFSTSYPVLVDFWADWCRPCAAVAPILEELALEYDGKLIIGKVNVDKYPRVAAGLGVRSIPTMVVFSGGEERERLVGSYSKLQIIKTIEAVLAQIN
jgi:thioredoxin 1